MVSPLKSLSYDNRTQWRAWLEQNHTKESEAWLVLFKKKHQDQGLALDAAVEEALCFGWIDSVLKPLDEKRYLLRFSPRSASSIWSMNNIYRVQRLMGRF